MFNVPFLLSLFPRDSLANRRRHAVAGVASPVASGAAASAAAGGRAIEAGCRYRQGADQEDGQRQQPPDSGLVFLYIFHGMAPCFLFGRVNAAPLREKAHCQKTASRGLEPLLQYTDMGYN